MSHPQDLTKISASAHQLVASLSQKASNPPSLQQSQGGKGPDRFDLWTHSPGWEALGDRNRREIGLVLEGQKQPVPNIRTRYVDLPEPVSIPGYPFPIECVGLKGFDLLEGSLFPHLGSGLVLEAFLPTPSGKLEDHPNQISPESGDLFSRAAFEFFNALSLLPNSESDAKVIPKYPLGLGFHSARLYLGEPVGFALFGLSHEMKDRLSLRNDDPEIFEETLTEAAVTMGTVANFLRAKGVLQPSLHMGNLSRLSSGVIVLHDLGPCWNLDFQSLTGAQYCAGLVRDIAYMLAKIYPFALQLALYANSPEPVRRILAAFFKNLNVSGIEKSNPDDWMKIAYFKPNHVKFYETVAAKVSAHLQKKHPELGKFYSDDPSDNPHSNYHFPSIHLEDLSTSLEYMRRFPGRFLLPGTSFPDYLNNFLRIAGYDSILPDNIPLEVHHQWNRQPDTFIEQGYFVAGLSFYQRGTREERVFADNVCRWYVENSWPSGSPLPKIPPLSEFGSYL